MKIAWFTPFAKDSAIGRASRLITDELAKLAEVHIWHPAAAEIYSTRLRTICLPASIDKVPAALSEYDIAVYNLGNHLSFHRQIFEVSRKARGIVVLHDFVMHHFFAAYLLEHKRDPKAYLATMAGLYGPRGKAVTEAAKAGRSEWIWETEQVAEFPLFEEAIRGAWAVVVHSEFCRARVADVFSGLVRKLDLPYNVQGGKPVLSRKELGIPEDVCLVVTVGQVNTNKLIHAVIQAMAGMSDLKGRVLYVVAGWGSEAYLRRLRELVARRGLERTVQFAGYMADERLHSLLVHADICVNLRFPSTEGASASAIEEMLYGKPVIVTRHGFCAELPDDCVVKVSAERVDEELPQVLCRLVNDPQGRLEMGARAQCYAERHFRADLYAQGVRTLADEVIAAKPLLQYADRVGEALAQMGVHAGEPVIDTVARISHELFCRGGGAPGVEPPEG